MLVSNIQIKFACHLTLICGVIVLNLADDNMWGCMLKACHDNSSVVERDIHSNCDFYNFLSISHFLIT